MKSASTHRRGPILGLFATLAVLSAGAMGGCETDILIELDPPGESDDDGVTAASCDKLHQGDLNLSNAPPAGLVSLCGVTGNLTLSHPTNKDAAKQAKNIKLVQGNLIYADTYGQNAETLQKLQTVEGDVTIQGCITAGLSSLTSIGGNLVVTHNKCDLSGLNSLKRVNGNVQLNAKNAKLTSLERIDGDLNVSYLRDNTLTGLGNLKTIGKSLRLGGQLSSIAALSGLRSVGHHLVINGGKFTSLTALSGVTSWGASVKDFTVQVQNSHGLTKLDGLDGLTKVGRLTVQTNYNMKSMAIPNLTEVGHLKIRYNKLLASVSMPKVKVISSMYVCKNAMSAQQEAELYKKFGGDQQPCN